MTRRREDSAIHCKRRNACGVRRACVGPTVQPQANPPAWRRRAAPSRACEPPLGHRLPVREGTGADLDTANGWGHWKGTAVGEAVIAWGKALGEWRSCMARAEHYGWRERHRLHRRADRDAEREGPLRERFEALATPERARLQAELPEAKKLHDDLHGRHAGHLHYEVARPEALRRLDLLDHQIDAAT